MGRQAPQIRVYLLVGPPIGAVAAVTLELFEGHLAPHSASMALALVLGVAVLAYPFGALPAVFTGLLSLGFRRYGPVRYVGASMLIGALVTTLPVVGMAALVQAGTPDGDDAAAVLRAGLLAAAVGAPAAMACALTTLLWPADFT